MQRGTRRFISRLIMGAALVTGVCYVIWRREEFAPLLEVPFWGLVAVAAAALGSSLVGARMLQVWMRHAGGAISFWRSWMLRWAVGYWNLVPVKPGTGALAYYLKRRHGIAYGDYASWVVAKNVTGLLAVGGIGLLATVPYAVAGRLTPAIPSLFGVIMVGCLAALLFPLRWSYGGSHWLLSRLARLARAWSRLSADRAFLAHVLALYVGGWVIRCFSVWLCFHLTGTPLGAGQAVVVSVLRGLARLAAIVPQQLVVREALSGAGARAFGFTFADGVVATVLGRAVLTVLLLALGFIASRQFARGLAGLQEST